MIVDNLIYDIGMHNGDDTAYYLSLGYKVIAVEASPILAEEGRKRFKENIENDQLEIINVGVAEREDYMNFYLSKLDSVWNSFDKSIASREGSDVETIQVRTTTVDRIMNEKGVPYYMKIDIEGNDASCIEALTNCDEMPKYISAEMSNQDMIVMLKHLGYKKFKIIHQPSLLPLELPMLKEYRAFLAHNAFNHSMNFFIRIIRKLFSNTINKNFERRYKYLFNYKHPYGSSGPFAESLPGKWFDFDQILRIFLYFKSVHENSGKDTGYNYWIDIHATT